MTKVTYPRSKVQGGQPKVERFKVARVRKPTSWVEGSGFARPKVARSKEAKVRKPTSWVEG